MKGLTHLGATRTDYPQRLTPALLETFPNPRPGRAYTIEFETDEVTSLCPATGQPDFYHVAIRYVPGATCIESKSLKLYLFSYRNTGLFAEEMANRLLEDLVAASSPRWMEIDCRMRPRGGIALQVRAEHGSRAAASGGTGADNAE